MTDQHASDRDVSRAIRSWLREDRHEDASRVAGAVLDQLEATPQRPATWWRAWRMPFMNNFAKLLVATAAVVAVAFVGFNLLPGSQTGAGGPPPASPAASPTPAATPRASPTPSATPAGIQGDLQPGTYTAQLSVGDAIGVTFTVPEGWTAYADPPGVLRGLWPAGDPTTGPPGGIAIQLRDVTTLKGDPCHWSGTDDDIPVGPTADDLVEALQGQTAYEASDPVDVTIGGFAGQRVDIVTEPDDAAAVGCDDGVMRPWDGEIYSQGPDNRWQTNVLDVDGTRLVVVVQDFPGTTAADRAELDAIVDSMVIEP